VGTADTDRKSCRFSLAAQMSVWDFADGAVASMSWKCSTGRVALDHSTNLRKKKILSSKGEKEERLFYFPSEK